MSGEYPIPANSGGGAATPAELGAQLAAESAASTQLKAVRTSAEKWAGAVGTLLGLFAITGFVKGPEDLMSLDPTWRPGFLVLIALGLLLGLVATLLAARAAYGWPAQAPLTGLLYEQWQASAARTSARCLVTAVVSAVSGYLLLVAAVGLLWFGPRAQSPTLTLVVTQSSLVCGRLASLEVTGLSILDPLTGIKTAIPYSDLRVIETVSACP